MTKRKVEALTLDQMIREYIQLVLEMTDKNQSQAARILGLPLSTLRSKMKRLGIDRKGEGREPSFQLNGGGQWQSNYDYSPLDFHV